MSGFFSGIIDLMGILDLVFPKKCLECGKEGRYICLDCIGKVKKVKPICPYCERASIDGAAHFTCRRKFGIDGLTSIWEYSGVIRKAILAFKYKYAGEVGKELSEIFVDALKSLSTSYNLPATGTLVPIPLHWYRGNFRGFNQSEEIGRLIVRRMGWRFIPDLLVRKKLTIPQTELKAEDRSKNIRGVFAINPRYQPLAISRQPLILFDDVWTTGSTMKEAGKILKRAGAEKVWGLTIAK